MTWLVLSMFVAELASGWKRISYCDFVNRGEKWEKSNKRMKNGSKHDNNGLGYELWPWGYCGSNMSVFDAMSGLVECVKTNSWKNRITMRGKSSGFRLWRTRPTLNEMIKWMYICERHYHAECNARSRNVVNFAKTNLWKNRITMRGKSRGSNNRWVKVLRWIHDKVEVHAR